MDSPGALCDFGGCFLEGFVCAFFVFFFGGSLVSLVENVVFCVFGVVFSAHRFKIFEGVQKEGVSRVRFWNWGSGTFWLLDVSSRNHYFYGVFGWSLLFA